MTEMENAVGTLTDQGIAPTEQETMEEGAHSAAEDCEGTEFEFSDAERPQNDEIDSERAEYERLIKNRFKRFYTEDTQRMINKRFKRYKAMEERLASLEAQSASALEREQGLIAQRERLAQDLEDERARIESEVEARVVRELLASRSRPAENGYAQRVGHTKRDVSRLTRDERADIAKRALGGEKISF
ncbi:MAG: hypothetical protein IJC64_03985 [Clostridia bacterium]|nr:hypothetical protein [Clostridia bacterium]